MRTTKTVTVEVPEISTLPLDPAVVQQLDTLCQAARVVQSQIKPLEEIKAKLMDDGEGGGIKPLAAALGLSGRVLGTGWDLRPTPPKSSVNIAKLKLALLHQSIQVKVICPRTVEGPDGTSQICPVCNGTGLVVLVGLPAINHLIDECTEYSKPGWAVYARSEKEDPT